ncbi:MAG TPA: FAD-dependent oxidoreductase, partial [Terriglobia bacterium]|nr:FAD-dependent oxidoreductase [Terriglobia bacterium]
MTCSADFQVGTRGALQSCRPEGRRYGEPGGTPIISTTAASSALTLARRDVLKMAGSALAASLVPAPLRPQAPRPKKVIIAGGGIAGLCCGYELMKRGHEVVVLEAAGHPGGHVRTIHDPLADGLYADVGAEHFTQPGYDLYWGYVREFGLTPLYYPRREHLMRWIRGKMRSEEDLADPNVLASLGLNQRESDFLVRHPWWDFASLYYQPYVDSFHDEYRPYDSGLNQLDHVSWTDVLEKDGASAAAIEFIGGNGSA